MTNVLDRLAVFAKKARSGPVKVNVYAPQGGAQRAPARLILYASLIAAGFVGAVATMQIGASDDLQPTQAIDPQGIAIPHVMPSEPAKEEAPELKYVQVRFQGKTYMTLDAPSRLMLVKEAAEYHGLEEVGLNWKDLYGVIHAETAWIARDGMGKNGVVSSGLAQFEPNTAKAMEVADPNDPVAAIRGAAELMKHAAEWSRAKIRKGGISQKEHAAKLREGVSIYYNLSTRGRNTWNARNTSEMPMETRAHIKNVKDGAQIAKQVGVQLDKERAQDKAFFQEAEPPARAPRRVYIGAMTGQASADEFMNLSASEKLRERIKYSSGEAVLEAEAIRSSETVLRSLLTARCTDADIEKLKQPSKAGEFRYKIDPDSCISHAVNPYRVKSMLSEAGTGARLLGFHNKSAVFAVDATDFNAIALRAGDQGLILFADGMLKEAKGGSQLPMLAFVLEHEQAHLELAHAPSLEAEVTARQELEADATSIDKLHTRGFNSYEIRDGVSAFHHQVTKVISGESSFAVKLMAGRKFTSNEQLDRIAKHEPPLVEHPRER